MEKLKRNELLSQQKDQGLDFRDFVSRKEFTFIDRTGRAVMVAAMAGFTLLGPVQAVANSYNDSQEVLVASVNADGEPVITLNSDLPCSGSYTWCQDSQVNPCTISVIRCVCSGGSYLGGA